jgi:hypothetical protein
MSPATVVHERVCTRRATYTEGPDGRRHGRGPAKMTDYPMNRSPRCGAHARTTGKPCMAPCLRGRRRCRLHGGWSPGAPRGAQHPNYRTGKYTRDAAEVSQFFRELRRDADVVTATTMHKHGLRPVKALRRRRHVRKALAEAKGEQK